MNYLAHLYFAGEDEGRIVGNFLGDFVKGTLSQLDYSHTVINGIQMHRRLDKLADDKIIHLLDSTDMQFRHRRYAGIAFDLSCDHFLACYWEDFHAQEKKHFSESRMAILKNHQHLFNDKASLVLDRMERYRWLENYQDLAFIEQVFVSIHKRFPKNNTIDKAFMDLHNNYQSMEYFCLDFLQALSKNFLATAASTKIISQKL